MTLHCTRPVAGRAPFGLFHNFDASYEEVGYLFVHLFGGTLGITWSR